MPDIRKVREDLRLRDYAEAKGWTPVFNDNDIRYRRTGRWPGENYPHHDIRFKKGDKIIWASGQSYPSVKFWWRCAGAGERYEQFRKYDTLEEAIDAES